MEQQIFTKEGKVVSELVRSETKNLAENEVADFRQTILVNKPTLWTTKSYHPQLYVLKTKVYKEGTTKLNVTRRYIWLPLFQLDC